MKRQDLEEKIREHSLRYEPDFYRISITYVRDPVNKVIYHLILNERRKEEVRVGKIANLQSFQKSIDEFKKGNYNNTTVLSKYKINGGPLFYIALNPRPIFKGALMLIRDIKEGKTIDDEIDKKSLETEVGFCSDTGSVLWHNGIACGVTIREAHWQGFFYQDFNIAHFKREELNGSGIYTMPTYPGENFVFIGNQKIKKCLEVVDYLNKRPFYDTRPLLSPDLQPKFYETPKHTPFCIGIANNEIYLIPVKNEYAALSLGVGCTRIAGAELLLPGIITTEETDYIKINGGETIVNGRKIKLSPKKIHEYALFEHGIIIYELGLHNHTRRSKIQKYKSN